MHAWLYHFQPRLTLVLRPLFVIQTASQFHSLSQSFGLGLQKWDTEAGCLLDNRLIRDTTTADSTVKGALGTRAAFQGWGSFLMGSRGERSHDWHDHVTGGKPSMRVSFEKQVNILLETKPPCLILRLLKPRSGHVTPHRLPFLETRGLSVGHITSLTLLPLRFDVVLGLRDTPRGSTLQCACADGEAGETGWFAASP